MYIDPDLVINKENFKLIEYNVVCSICNGIVVSPVQCLECENCFCQSCIEEWKKKQGKDSCPFRCKNPSFRNSRLIKDILSNLKFKCKNGCNQEIYVMVNIKKKQKKDLDVKFVILMYVLNAKYLKNQDINLIMFFCQKIINIY